MFVSPGSKLYKQMVQLNRSCAEPHINFSKNGEPTDLNVEKELKEGIPISNEKMVNPKIDVNSNQNLTAFNYQTFNQREP